MRRAQHKGRERHCAAIPRDELTRDEVGVEIEVAHAGRALSKGWLPLTLVQLS